MRCSNPGLANRHHLKPATSNFRLKFGKVIATEEAGFFHPWEMLCCSTTAKFQCSSSGFSAAQGRCRLNADLQTQSLTCSPARRSCRTPLPPPQPRTAPGPSYAVPTVTAQTLRRSTVLSPTQGAGSLTTTVGSNACSLAATESEARTWWKLFKGKCPSTISVGGHSGDKDIASTPL